MLEWDGAWYGRPNFKEESMAVGKQKARLYKALASWQNLNSLLRTISESDCHKLLEIEGKENKRDSFLLRIHARYNILRAQRERRELLKGI